MCPHIFPLGVCIYIVIYDKCELYSVHFCCCFTSWRLNRYDVLTVPDFINIIYSITAENLNAASPSCYRIFLHRQFHKGVQPNGTRCLIVTTQILLVKRKVYRCLKQFFFIDRLVSWPYGLNGQWRRDVLGRGKHLIKVYCTSIIGRCMVNHGYHMRRWTSTFQWSSKASFAIAARIKRDQQKGFEQPRWMQITL